ncbi:MAG: peptidase, partial [Bacteroidota bacterium]
MKKSICIIATLFLSISILAQKPLESLFDPKDMQHDLKLFREIRDAANSGVYKYRTKKEIDSIYAWAEKEILHSSTLREFHNILWQITDFEGSLHNAIHLHFKTRKALREETKGYFPYPIKIIEGKVLLNINTNDISIGSEILSINGEAITNILPQLYKYYTTDGFNLTGKEIGINENFSQYYRLNHGLKDHFQVTYKDPTTAEIRSIEIESVGYRAYYKNFEKRHSLASDSLSYEGTKGIQYTF